jgi:hypothetical protein
LFTLKLLHKEGIPAALDKAERYRLLNEPAEAESICLDVLAIEPEHQQALITLLLALTDQFEQGIADRQARARALLPRLAGEYERTYYAGLISERRGKAALKDGTLALGSDIYEWLTEAMALYEKAEALRPPGNDEARLRWNACARKLNSNESLRPHDEASSVPYHD